MHKMRADQNSHESQSAGVATGNSTLAKHIVVVDDDPAMLEMLLTTCKGKSSGSPLWRTGRQWQAYSTRDPRT
jgi:hypothetical protein